MSELLAACTTYVNAERLAEIKAQQVLHLLRKVIDPIVPGLYYIHGAIDGEPTLVIDSDAWDEGEDSHDVVSLNQIIVDCLPVLNPYLHSDIDVDKDTADKLRKALEEAVTMPKRNALLKQCGSKEYTTNFGYELEVRARERRMREEERRTREWLSRQAMELRAAADACEDEVYGDD